MQIQQHHPDTPFFVRWCGGGRVRLLDRELSSSFLMSPAGLIEDWPATTVSTLSVELLEACLALNPELLLLGTGETQVFPPPALLVSLLKRGIGVEVMDNASAARTFNLLAQDGRAVVVGFLLGPPSDGSS